MELPLSELLKLSREEREYQLADINQQLEKMTAQERVRWGIENLGGAGSFMVSSSFGIQSAVMLHLLTQAKPDIYVVLTDTQYLFPETYRFIDELTRSLKLNLQVYRAKECGAWQEARFGKLWEQGADGIAQYNTINKTEPMARALKELEVGTWFAGLRRSQSSTRSGRPVLSIDKTGVFKMLPIVDWSDQLIDDYLKDNKLPYHPLKYEGYVSMGDWHTTTKLLPGMKAEDTRFHGLKRECGLHDDDHGNEAEKPKKIGKCSLLHDSQFSRFVPFKISIKKED